jgi:peptidoglycan hydrolase-like protein with peptidoglycan-binding domain
MTLTATLEFGEKTAKSGVYDEHPPNSNITQAWIDYHSITNAPAYQRSPWCGAAAIASLHAGGWTPPANWIGVLAIQSWGEAHGRWVRGASGLHAGDTLVLFGPGIHTGVARSEVRADGSFLSEEGNTSPGDVGSQWNGGTYALKVRRVSDLYGYVVTRDLIGGGTPPTPGAADRKPEQPQYRKEQPTGDLHLWETGPRVEKLQDALGLDSDGYYGRSTAQHVRAFKVAHHLGADGGTADLPLLKILERHGPAKPPTPPTLHPGDKGGAVRKLQRRLIAHGYLPAVADGHRQDDSDFGDRTKTAVNAVKHAHHLPADGVAGSGVWDALR